MLVKGYWTDGIRRRSLFTKQIQEHSHTAQPMHLNSVLERYLEETKQITSVYMAHQSFSSLL